MELGDDFPFLLNIYILGWWRWIWFSSNWALFCLCQTAGGRQRKRVQIGIEPRFADKTFRSAGDELSLWCSIFTLSHPQFHFLPVSKKKNPRHTLTEFREAINVSVSAYPFFYSPVCHLLGDGCCYGEQRLLKFYLDFQNVLLPFSVTRWDNSGGLR